jgi:hypothetical protein
MQTGEHFRGHAAEKGQRPGRLAALELNPRPWDEAYIMIVTERVPDSRHKAVNAKLKIELPNSYILQFAF